jgi:ubiquinone/menaquinone biosynthesis C-methylase UbiE
MMGCHGGFSLDENTRRSWYNPEAVLSDLKDGMTFADIGCGNGFFSIVAAKIVGVNGKVYAVDIDPIGIKKLNDKAKAEGLTNITAQAGNAEDTVFCKSCVDIVFFSMDLHDFNDATKVLQNAKQMLKPTGHLIDLDWKKMQMPFGPPEAIRFSEQHVAGLLKAAGLKMIDTKEAGPYHYIVTAKT